MAQRESFVELVRRHPFMLIDDAAPRPDQDAAKARQRHFREGDEELDEANGADLTFAIGLAAISESEGQNQSSIRNLYLLVVL